MALRNWFRPAFLLLLLLFPALSLSSRVACPFLHSKSAQQELEALPSRPVISHRSLLEFKATAVDALDIDAVKADLRTLFTTSQAWWPADFGNYGPLMIRLAWHCAGSYRSSDGRGGCDGARQRFDPERSWADNTNLDKARALLAPIKAKYGAALTWGDLIVLAGDTAIESMGGPIIGFCGGRIDDADGTASLPLGPTPESEQVAPCPKDGECKAPQGRTTMQLIYVNPEGPLANPVPELSVPDIRDTFARMGMNDSETIALIGGGHAFGKAHGACPTGAGPSPKEQPSNPWPGSCGEGEMRGRGPNTFTSGFEGPWTTTPTKWSNEYFQNLLNFDWQRHIGLGGHNQWRPVPKPGAASNNTPPTAMLTTDVALLKDPSYLELVKLYASNLSALEHAFGHAWYKLMTRDMGPVTRCLGSKVPPAQPFQAPLPPPPTGAAPDYSQVARDVVAAFSPASTQLEQDSSAGAIQPDNTTTNSSSTSTYAPLFAALAWQCGSSYRDTDHTGGCNGARIRFAPQKDWPQNKGMDQVLALLAPIKAKYSVTLSWGDLIVLAGTEAVRAGGANGVRFCPGRVDATDDGVEVQPPRTFDDPLVQVRDNWAVMGLTTRQGVALAARPQSPSLLRLQGYSGGWTAQPERVSNDFFKVLLTNTWINATSPSNQTEFRAAAGGGQQLVMTPVDMAVRWDPELLAIAQEYQADNDVFLQEFAAAWYKLMNADRFKGPDANACDQEPPAK